MTSEIDARFESLLEFLKHERGFDFTGYKRPSLIRRVRRRMDDLGIGSFEDYHDYLLFNPDEFTALFNTILINVTSFFRDPDPWRYLKDEVLPQLLARRGERPIRVWSAGCASGEEAFTTAMVLAELIGLDGFKRRVKIYATDVDEEALTTARQASFTEHEVEGVPEDLQQRFFDQSGQRYVMKKDLRRAVIFGRNDLVKDAPISHVDLLICRNTLMYFNSETQSEILQRLHFALLPDGVLFLGKAEMLLSHPNLFRPIELKKRLFTKATVAPPQRSLPAQAEIDRLAAKEDELLKLRQAALTSSQAAQIVLDHAGNLALCTSRAATLFGITERDHGRPFQDLEVSYRPVELRSHISEAMATRESVWVRDVVSTQGRADPMFFDVQVTPLVDEAGTGIGTSVTFIDVTHSRRMQDELEYTNKKLETAYEELQSTNEELETTNEELQSTIEELETTNEELQSTNEELETINEELQSMNDELHVTSEEQGEQQVRSQLVNQFLSSVLGTMQLGVAVVDKELKVVSWNAQAEELWGVSAEETEGLALSDLDIGLPVELVLPALERQLADGLSTPERLRLQAVNRRGRTINVDITASRVAADGPQSDVALLVMTVAAPGDAGS